MKDDPLVDVRLYCIGRCGAFTYLPAKLAVSLMTIHGNYQDDAPAYVCPKCRAWFTRETCRLLLGEHHEEKS